MNQHNEEQLTKLAPSGVSPWNDSAMVDKNGCLVLYWDTGNGGTRIRTFTQEETLTLYKLLKERLEGD